MSWNILFHDDFADEFATLTESLQDELLVGGDKGGVDQRRFYKRLITVADERLDGHLDTLKTSHKEHRHGKKT